VAPVSLHSLNMKISAGSPITSKGAFGGSNGPQWDALRIGVPASLLPAGTTSAANSLSLVPNVTGDCLAWAYSALSYQWAVPLSIL
jgi:hypothetical protein